MTILESDDLDAGGMGRYQGSIEGKHVMFYGHVRIVPGADEEDVAVGQGRGA